MPELQFTVEGEPTDDPQRGQRNRRTRFSTGGARVPRKIFGLSLKTALIILVAAVTLRVVDQTRSVLSLESFAPGLTRQPAPNGPDAFGTTTWSAHSLKGKVYLLSGGCDFPDFTTAKPVNTIYTKELNITARSVAEGFPGVIGPTQPYAIDYTGSFSIGKNGDFTFTLDSDDGSKLFIDDKLIIDNGDCHGPRAITQSVPLRRGFHQLRVQYFENQEGALALVLTVRRE